MYPGEGVQQGDQVLGGLDAADPDERVRAAVVLALAERVEPGGLHAGVHGAQLRGVGAAALLPAAGVGVAGGDERGLPVDLGGEQSVEPGEEGAHRRTGRGVAGCEVVRPYAYGVLGDQQRGAEEAFGQQSRQCGGAAGRGVAEVDGGEAVLVVPVEGEGRSARSSSPVKARRSATVAVCTVRPVPGARQAASRMRTAVSERSAAGSPPWSAARSARPFRPRVNRSSATRGPRCRRRRRGP